MNAFRGELPNDLDAPLCDMKMLGRPAVRSQVEDIATRRRAAFAGRMEMTAIAIWGNNTHQRRAGVAHPERRQRRSPAFRPAPAHEIRALRAFTRAKARRKTAALIPIRLRDA